MGFILAEQGSRGVHKSAYGQNFPKNTSFNTVRATTSANSDLTHRCIQDGGIAGLENIHLVTKFVVESSSSRLKVDVFSDSTVVCWSLESRSIQHMGNKNG